MKIEIEAIYDFSDIKRLIESDLAANGYQAVGGIPNELERVLRFSIEQTATTPAQLPAPALTESPVTSEIPAPVKEKKSTRKVRVNLANMTIEEKRAYWRENKKKQTIKEIATKHGNAFADELIEMVPEVVAPSVAPFRSMEDIRLELEEMKLKLSLNGQNAH